MYEYVPPWKMTCVMRAERVCNAAVDAEEVREETWEEKRPEEADAAWLRRYCRTRGW